MGRPRRSGTPTHPPTGIVVVKLSRRDICQRIANLRRNAERLRDDAVHAARRGHHLHAAKCRTRADTLDARRHQLLDLLAATTR